MSLLKITVKDSIEVVADKVILLASVLVAGDNHKDAMEKGTNKTAEVINLLGELGVDKSCIETKKLSIAPIIKRFTKQNITFGGKTNKVEEELTGYRYTSKLSIKLDADSTVLADAYIKLVGLNEYVSDVCYYYEFNNKEEYSDILLKSLLKKANDKAKLMADTLGVSIKGVDTIDKVVSRITVSYNSFETADFGSIDCLDESAFEDNSNTVSSTMFSIENIPTDTLTDEVTVHFIISND